MAWTSHAFHVVKDLQTFAAALVAFAAAGLTFYSQKRVSDRQAETAVTTLKIKEKQDRTLADEATHRLRTAYLVRMSVALSDLKVKNAFRAQQADLFARSTTVSKYKGTLSVNNTDISWSVLISFKPLLDRHPVITSSMSDVEKIPASVQRDAHLLQIALSDIDVSLAEMVNFSKQHQFVLDSQPFAFRQLCVNAISLIEAAENDVEAELKKYGINHIRSSQKVETTSVLDPSSSNYRQDIVDGLKASRKV